MKPPISQTVLFALMAFARIAYPSPVSSNVAGASLSRDFSNTGVTKKMGISNDAGISNAKGISNVNSGSIANTNANSVGGGYNGNNAISYSYA